MQTRSLLAFLCLPLLGACFLSAHKIDVQQGNYLDQASVAKLKPGMIHSQVKFLLGTPLIADPFHPERWDYLYFDSNGGKHQVDFVAVDENKMLARQQGNETLYSLYKSNLANVMVHGEQLRTGKAPEPTVAPAKAPAKAKAKPAAAAAPKKKKKKT